MLAFIVASASSISVRAPWARALALMVAAWNSANPGAMAS